MRPDQDAALDLVTETGGTAGFIQTIQRRGTDTLTKTDAIITGQIEDASARAAI